MKASLVEGVLLGHRNKNNCLSEELLDATQK